MVGRKNVRDAIPHAITILPRDYYDTLLFVAIIFLLWIRRPIWHRFISIFFILFHCRKREREKLRVEPARRGATGRTRKRHPSPSVMTRRGGEGSFYISLVHTNIPPSSTPTLVLLLFYSSFSVCPVSVPRDLFF